MDITRRRFLQSCAAGSALVATGPSSWALEPVSVENPLGSYPSRGWEKIYLDQYAYDDTFTWICAPNDTHMCRLRAFVRNGVVIRSEQNYDHQRYGDLYGNRATQAWNPRACPKGFTMQRRVYGPYRLKGPVLRKGWKAWADAGYPSLSERPELRTEYKFDDRGNDGFVRVTWDEAAQYVAGALEAVARIYSGEEGAARLAKDGYEQVMIDKVEGAGTRTVKIGSNLPIHGVIGKFGIYRFANVLGLLDHHVRGVPAEKARGARDWNEYTWRGDQAPGHPYVHSLQTSDMDFNDMRFSKLIIQIGKNLIENKMPESHWLNECMERGAKLVDIAPEYNCPATKSDYFIGVRAGLSDTAVLLGVTKIMLDNNWYKPDFCRQFTDFPLLVRTDTLKRLRPQDVQADYQPKDISAGPSYKIQGLKEDQRQRIGDFCIWDNDEKEVAFISRDEVGNNLKLPAALEGTFQVTLADGEKVEVMTILEMYRRHLKDYDEKTVNEISGADPKLVRRLAEDIWKTTEAGHPVAIHIGEGINHYFHATLHNRASYLPLMLTGNIGHHGAGGHTWAGNYKGALLQASPWSGPGVGSYTAEDPFKPVLDEKARITHEDLHHYSDGEDPSYWACGERTFTVDLPKGGPRNFTGKSHIPTPTKVIWYNNANFLNQSKWIYNLIAGEYGGEPGAALMLFRTYPRVPFWEQIHDSIPFYTDSGRMHSYCDLPEAIEYGENLIVHREAVEATPYLPNVIVSTSEFIRPVDYGIPLDTTDADLRQVRNIKMPWDEVKKTKNPLWTEGYAYFCCTPKSRHSTHSSWSTVDWHWIWSDNFGDPHRTDKRAPGVADRQIQMNPQAARDAGINEGDYVWVDANELDRPYIGWKDDDGPRHKAFRCLVRVKFNPGLPYSFTIMKHTGWIASERSVKAHETRADGRALAADTGYQASYRYGSHQSITRNWMMPMHQTDTLFHKKTGAMGFTFGFDVDNHAINTVPKETLVRITKAEDGGIGGVGLWKPAESGYSPGNDTPQNARYLTGRYTQVRT